MDYKKRRRKHISGRYASRKADGFTLLEVLIAIMIIGFFLLPLTHAAKIWRYNVEETKLDSGLDEMRSAFAEYVQDERCVDPANPSVVQDDSWCVANGYPERASESSGGTDAVRFPCPADPTLPRGHSDYGIEDCSLTPVAGVMIGAVPAATIGLPVSSMIDPYGNKFTYAVTVAATTTDALLGSPAKSVIIDNEGTSIQSYFTVISHGRSGNGAYTAEGAQRACDSGVADETNCDGNATFAFKQGYYEAEGSDFYDDRLAFSLVDDQDDEWWQATDSSAVNITHKNPGNIGIGTAGPITKLHVKGDEVVDGVAVTNDAGEAVVWLGGHTYNNTYSSLYIDDKNVGGDNDPWIWSHKQGGANEGDLWLQHGMGGTRLLAFDNTDETIGVKRNPDPAYTIDIEGNIRSEGLEITSSDVQAVLLMGGKKQSNIYSALYLDDEDIAGDNDPWVWAHKGGGANEGDLWLQHGAVRILAFDNVTGNIGVQKDPNTSYAIDVNGDMRANTYLHSSDERLKTNITDLGTGTLDKVMDLRTVTYNLKESPHDPKKLGVIAQNLQESFPELVTKADDGFLAVDYPGLTVPALKAIQELKAQKDVEIKTLHDENEMLKDRLLQLESRLDALDAGVKGE